MRRDPLLVSLLLLALHALPARAEGPARVALEGVKADVQAPEGAWEHVAETPAAGQWRVAFRSGAAQCEARVFPLQDADDPKVVLMQAADKVSRQVRADGFGLPGIRLLTLDGRPAAESTWWVVSGVVRQEGRIRLLRAGERAWALAWGLAPGDASAAIRAAAHDFAGSLAPTEPAFHEPSVEAEDPEQVVAQDRGGPVVRRQLLAALATLEAGGDFRFPDTWRGKALEALAQEARTGTETTRTGFRELAAQVAESQGLSAADRATVLKTLGQRLLEALFRRAQEGEPTAQRLALIVSVGRRPVAGEGEAALTRFDAEAWAQVLAFLAAFAADAGVELTSEQREAAVARLSGLWPALSAEERGAVRRLAREAPDLGALYRAADAPRRLAFRLAVVDRLRPAAPGSAPAGDVARALRARLDVPGDPRALLEALGGLPVADVARLADALRPPPPPAAPPAVPGDPAPGR